MRICVEMSQMHCVWNKTLQNGGETMKKMKERLFSLLLILAMALSAAGCGASGDGSGSGADGAPAGDAADTAGGDMSASDAAEADGAGTGPATASEGEKIINIGVTDSLGGVNPFAVDQTEINKYAMDLMFLPLM